MKTLSTLLIFLLALFSGVVIVADGFADDTMLMLVGEADPVTTIASRQPESPLQAPAMMTVVDHEQIERRGYRTLSELLSDQPGFFILTGGRGSIPYLRGLRDAVLFLYDGVPINTDVTKSFAPLGQEFSLSGIDRVEIMTGPGSVLWGADAFAAVVNMVPARAVQRPGVSAGVAAGNQHFTAGQLSLGSHGETIDLFLHATGSAERYHDDHYQTDVDQYGSLDNSHFAELVGTLQYRQWLHLSGRWSDFKRKFTMTDAANKLTWNGSKQTPFNYLKFSATGNHGAAHYSLNGFLQETDYRLRDAGLERRQTNRTSQLELLWDQRVWERGLMTVGGSWRRNEVDGALIKDGFLPDFLLPDEPLFTPNIEQKDYSSDVFSAFGQFRYRWGNSEWWFGGRLEDHSEYADALSTSMGFQIPWGNSFHFKAVYGSAFRTPYSRQLFDATSLKQEKIRTLTSRLDWNPAPKQLYSLTLFHNHVSHHRSEDPYGGLSKEQTLKMYGAELALNFPLGKSVTAFAGFTWVHDIDEQEKYSVLAYSIVPPGGDPIDVYDNWSQSYEQGPEWLARFSLDWSISTQQNLLITVATGGDIDGNYAKGTIEESYQIPTLVSLTYNRPGFFSGRDRFSLRITNLLDEDYQCPDVYGPAEGDPLTLTLAWIIDF